MTMTHQTMTHQTIIHHPTDLTLADFAAGHLDEGRALVVATHLVGCAACRKAARSFEYLRGVVLEDSPRESLAPDALQRALAAISSDGARPAGGESHSSGATGPLSAYPLGRWRWIGRSTYWRSVGVPAGQGTRVFMLRSAPGTRLPHHGHTGIEWTAVLQGAFRHQQGRYGAGDFDEADDSVVHTPIIEDGEECICIVALRGQVRFKSLIGRAIQPFVRI
jgi:putative transcriptional regulator